nr:MAG TPA: hypothetical protein [Caudoviricetes sp.]
MNFFFYRKDLKKFLEHLVKINLSSKFQDIYKND